jgi:hypothetical protein
MQLVPVVLALFTASLSATESKPALTNASIIKMLKAELAADTIVLAIEGSPGTYDTSPDALIELKNSGADQKVLDAIIRKNSGGSGVSQPVTANAPSQGSIAVPPQGIPTKPSSIGKAWLIDGTNRVEMKVTVTAPAVKTRVNWNPLVGPSRFADSLNRYPGARATLRLQNTKPSFEFGVPDNVQVNQHIQLSVLKVNKKHDYRELRTEKETVFKSGQLKESMIPIKLEEVKAEEFYGVKSVTYRATPENSLKSGEYVFQVSGSQYDFGVD